MVLKGWVGAVSGLASLLVDGPVTVQAGGRVLAHLPAGQHLVADALGEPGVPTVYTAGSESVTLTRHELGPGLGILAGTDGRPLPSVRMLDVKDSTGWEPDVHVFNARVRRWGTDNPPVSGTTNVIQLDASLVGRTRELLSSPGLVTLGTGRRFPGVTPMRTVVVTRASSDRFDPSGATMFTISWVEADPVSGGCPVVTWGEWAAWGAAHPEVSGWRAWSALEVARRVSGMPV